ncbi:zinc finger and BTB domain-containing protein 7B [Nerophis ophidion]|uniref:zinc finger and BTB domain-containing protein 7B n=1 Tax=Nerophis ophidion TaxID=159077 RepID=UPI002ADFA17D|nr:zinc finger and BTB domain-containing protein 7B [Nerophis ophidion]XP_061771279.1 zinc finger and BTB domain-containing protein 7B [Nerophis ophidion]XP_061771280.1 zinc finger and BTB domain-containing protein 7B [Nerophis ophidion]
MASQLATMLARGSPEVRNGGRCAEPPEAVTEDSKGTLRSSCLVDRDAPSINGELGKTRAPDPQQPNDKPRQPIRAKMVVAQPAATLTKDSTPSRLETNQIYVVKTEEEEVDAETLLLDWSEVNGVSLQSSLQDGPRREEQSEPLDLSLPKRPDNRETRYGRFLDTCESSLIMEVDEYDGEGDRDVVEEDDDEDFFSTFTSTDPQTKDLLLIDDQGIPYTLSPNGLRVPQLDASTSSQVLQTESEVSSQANLSQNLDDAPNGRLIPLPVVDSDALPPEPNQAIQILSSRSQGAPILLSSAQLSLSLTPGASSSMFLLLSTSDSASTPIAVLDPATGQLSQITAPVSLPLLSHPVTGSAPDLATSFSPTNSYGSEAISAEQVSNHNDKPLTGPTPDPSDAQSPAPAPDSEHLPLDDHLYFSSAAAPPSPPKLEPLDPVSAAESPSDPSARRVLYCQLCPRVFFYLSDLERHRITHSQKKPHVCQQCGKAFKRSSHLQRHKHIHTGQRNFVCHICTKRFREAGELQRHQRVHTGEKPYQCQLCHTRFAERNTLRRHTKRKHPYHQAAVEMLQGRGGEAEEEPAEWYSSTVSHPDNSGSETEP